MAIATTGYAERISKQQAQQIAEQFFTTENSANGQRRAPAVPLQLTYTSEGDELYVFNKADGEGWVIVAGDDGARSAVLGYGEKGSIVPEHMSDGLKAMLNEYTKSIGFLRQNGIKNKANNRLSRLSAEGRSVEPLLKTTWSQSAPYWNMCPEETYNGCVPTAMAQIMKYWRWPETGSGSHTNSSYRDQWGDLSQSTYDWDLMLDNYVEGEYTKAQGDAVALLMRDAGIAVNVHYFGLFGSGSNTENAYYAMVTHFGYSSDAEYHKFGEGHTEEIITDEWYEEWEEMLRQELDAGRPVFYTADGPAPPGHAFVCDGYKDQYFHFNMGWAGLEDGYYLTTAITIYHYGLNAEAITNLHPADAPRTCIDGLYYELKGDEAMVVACTDGSPSRECSITIPATITVKGRQYRVTKIWPGVFKDAMVSSLTIPGSIKTIPRRTFLSYSPRDYECPLKTLVLQDGIEELGDEAFYYCTSLEEVTMSTTIKKIGNSAFETCSHLSTINNYWGNQLVSIGDRAFAECYQMESLLSLPATLKYIGDNAFTGCRNVFSIFIESDARDFVIGSYAFYQSGVTYASGLEHAKEIRYGAFGDGKLKGEFTVQPTCQYGKNAIVGNFDKIILPAKLTDYDKECVRGTNAFEVKKGNKKYCSEDGLLLNLDKTILIAYPSFRQGESMIPNGVQKIASKAFYGCSFFDITLPGSLKEIEGTIPYKNYDAMTVTCLAMTPPTVGGGFPNNIHEYGRSELHIPIGTRDAYATHDVWGKFNKIVEDVAVSGKFCYEFKTGITFDIDENFQYIEREYYYSNVIGRNTAVDYKVVVTTADFLPSILANGKEYPVKEIKPSVFHADHQLKSLTVPDYIEYIMYGGLTNCKNLERIHLGKSLYSMDFSSYSNALDGCPKLHTVTVTDGNETFFAKDNLLYQRDSYNTTSVSLCYVPPCKWDGQKLYNRTTVRIADGTEIINDGIFSDHLRNVVIPASVKYVSGFSQCGKLAVVTNLATTPQEISYYEFEAIMERTGSVLSPEGEKIVLKATLQVPKGSKNAYASHLAWGKFQNIVEIDPNNFSPGEDVLEEFEESVEPDDPDDSDDPDNPDEPEVQEGVAVHRANGQVEYFSFAGHPIVTYEGDNLVMSCGNTRVLYTLKGLEKITFGSFTTSIDDSLISEGLSFHFDNDQIQIANAKAGEVIRVYNAAGRLVHLLHADGDGRLTISLDTLPAGVYVIQLSKTTYKILK